MTIHFPWFGTLTEPTLRILLVNTFHFRGGGDSTYAFNLADLLRSNGHDVAFFAMHDPRNLPDCNADLFVSHIDFRRLNQRKSPVSALKVAARSIYSVEARGKFTQLLGRFQPHLVHLQNIHAHITPSVIMEAKKRGLPVVWTLHDYKLICPNSHFLIDKTGTICEACGNDKYYQGILKRCKKGSFLASSMAAAEAYAHQLLGIRCKVDAFLAPSKFLRKKLLDRGFPKESVHHLPLLLDRNAFHISTTNDRYLLFLGKLDAIKGIQILLDACRLAPDVKLVIAGRVEEPLASRLPALLPSNARYVGMKHGDDLRSLLRNALAVIVPSLWYENQPYSILEAFASGKPVIASDLGGMKELVANNERGLLVPPGQVNALANAMSWIVQHPLDARRMGEGAYAYASAEHTPERHYERLLRIYREVGAIQ